MIKDLCLQAARKSNCDKIKFGAVVIGSNGDLLSTGWNHIPKSNITCKENCVGDIRKDVKSGTCVERCYSIHAEQHAVLNAGKREGYNPPYELAVIGILPDGTLFDNGGGFYCTVCARIMKSAGVKVVWIWTNDDWKSITVDEAWEQSYGMLE